MSSPFMGEVRVFAGTFAPQQWSLCNGQLLPISQNDALFALLGTTYGGDGVSTFALPDARGRTPVGLGQGPGLANRILGEKYGTETVTLLSANLPAHTHTVSVSDTTANQTAPDNNLPGNAPHYLPSTTTPTNTGTLHPLAISSVGGNQPHENMMPFLCLSFIICLQGLFPSHN
ncbi:phage tail protein [Cellvibrio japonicus]|uniref:Microcystin dependent protein MdpB n=1 Tax=Cellvibrio japonicus (strain Ueda107) TaxID=498211 RepID=B3PJI7_CELJU|nr:tail fiber protein [Cellvibrio japonicus]ACE85235.1 microcystin dependent protein; MdpB [Cellvibrio japonicus Ueda107]QEI11273.1 phage tail protein [Cellvibrio japonicus]QEI14847.1 phage tail protein [Cellvibrio japonicus]QEI18427.1 phage tail protein [Cellvibrio japonicus]